MEILIKLGSADHTDATIILIFNLSVGYDINITDISTSFGLKGENFRAQLVA